MRKRKTVGFLPFPPRLLWCWQLYFQRMSVNTYVSLVTNSDSLGTVICFILCLPLVFRSSSLPVPFSCSVVLLLLSCANGFVVWILILHRVNNVTLFFTSESHFFLFFMCMAFRDMGHQPWDGSIFVLRQLINTNMYPNFELLKSKNSSPLQFN